MPLLRLIWSLITAPVRLVQSLAHRLARLRQAVHRFLTEEPAEHDLPDVLATTVENPTVLLEQLNDLRKHLFRAVVVLLLTTAFSFSYAREILDFLARPVGGIGALRSFDVTESIGVFMRVSLLAGFSLALPYIALELLLFATPGLKPRARVRGLLAIPLVLIFFIGGMAFAYYAMLPTALPFLLNFMGISTLVRTSSYVRFVTSLLFWIGVSFEFPLVIYALAGMGIVHHKMLAQQWRLAVVAISIVAAAITPTIDPINMLLVMGPMILLYFLSVGLARIAEKPQSG